MAEKSAKEYFFSFFHITIFIHTHFYWLQSVK